MKHAFAGTGISFEQPYSFNVPDRNSDSGNDYLQKFKRVFRQLKTSVSDAEVEFLSPEVRPFTGNTFLHTSSGEPYNFFHQGYVANASMGLSFLKSWVSSGFLDKKDATEWLFPVLLSSREDAFDQAYKTLVAVSSPDIVLDYSVSKYRQGWGEGYLQFAVSILSDLGEYSLKPLESFLDEDPKEAEFFAQMIASNSKFSVRQKKELLTKLLHSTHDGVRVSLLEALRYETLDFSHEFANELRNDPSEEVKELVMRLVE